ncbi:hypothetical protein [Pedobacter antarcticus]|uniref:hypothetical protein n=1 Tax=Pedobacter antarcticus TaxID=34086 RepID=UPI002931CB50|nr:hypothetical protein [Pedobacter antarcticus]
MRKIILSLLLLIPVVAFAEASFTIKGTGDGLKNGDKIEQTKKAWIKPLKMTDLAGHKYQT